MIQVQLTHTEADLMGIKKLQLSNLPSHLSSSEKNSQGFVTCPYSVDDLRHMNTPYPHIIAKSDDTVVGYCLVMLKDHSHIMPVLHPMFELFSKLEVHGKPISQMNYFVMGQICIDKAHRGTSVFYNMYQHLRDQMDANFDIVITEISALNKRSLRAHEKQGFKALKEYTAPNGHPWVIVYWEW